MKLIKIEGFDCEYFFANEVIDEKNTLFNSSEFLWVKDIPWNLYKELQKGVNTRLVIFKIRFWRKDSESRGIRYDMPYCLVWQNDKIDLNILDQKIMDNSFNDQDFDDAFRTRVLQLICFHCRNEYIALVSSDSEPYFVLDENDHLDRLKTDLLKQKYFKLKSLRCPNCNNAFTVPTPKILYKYTGDCYVHD